MKKIRMCLLGVMLATGAAWSAEVAGGVGAEDALTKLKQGNERFVSGKVTSEHQTLGRAAETAKKGQHPFAVVIACGDSRVPLEVIFDQGIGDIFVVRVAGNIVGAIEAASVEYGVEHTGANLVVVLGHTHCGAIQAALTDPKSENPLVVLIAPVIKKLQTSLDTDALPKELFARLVEWANAQAQAEQLRKLSPSIRDAATKGKIQRGGHGGGHSGSAAGDESFRVQTAMYNIETGAVEWSVTKELGAKSSPDAASGAKASGAESKVEVPAVEKKRGGELSGDKIKTEAVH